MLFARYSSFFILATRVRLSTMHARGHADHGRGAARGRAHGGRGGGRGAARGGRGAAGVDPHRADLETRAREVARAVVPRMRKAAPRMRKADKRKRKVEEDEEEYTHFSLEVNLPLAIRRLQGAPRSRVTVTMAFTDTIQTLKTRIEEQSRCYFLRGISKSRAILLFPQADQCIVDETTGQPFGNELTMTECGMCMGNIDVRSHSLDQEAAATQAAAQDWQRRMVRARQGACCRAPYYEGIGYEDGIDPTPPPAAAE
jgi:hypothetical protein